MQFQVGLIDLPWDFLTHSDKGRGRSPKYDTELLTLDDFKALPVPDLMAKESALFFWVTDPFLEIGMDVVRAWGMQFVTVGFYWVKRTKRGLPCFGQGYYTRANPEQCWLVRHKNGKEAPHRYRSGTRCPKRKSKSVRRLIESEIAEHSEKPVESFERIERLFDGPYVELFARKRGGYGRPDWTYLGNEIDGRDIRESLPELIAYTPDATPVANIVPHGVDFPSGPAYNVPGALETPLLPHERKAA